MTKFLRNQPHPESSVARCTTDAGTPVRPAVDADARLCCAVSIENRCELYIVAQNNGAVIERFFRTEGTEFTSCGIFFRFPTAVKCMNTLTGGGKGYVFALADKAYLIDTDRRVLWTYEMEAPCAAAFFGQAQELLLTYGDVIYTVTDSGLTERGKIVIPGYVINSNRYDLISEQGDSARKYLGINALYWNGMYLFTFAQVFFRCARENLDTFMCMSRSLDENLSRRFLLLPNGGAGGLFIDMDGSLSLAYVGSTPFSVTYGKPAIVKLSFQELGFFRPQDGLVFENSPVDLLRPSDNGGVDIRDTFVYPAPDGWYYLTGTTARPGGTFWQNTNGILLWRSKDLSVWESLGKVFDYQQLESPWQSNIATNCWAPELCCYGGTYWITYSLEPGCGLLKSISGKPQGPYADMGRVVMRGIDSGFFQEDGTLYLVWQNGMVAPFHESCITFTREPVHLLPVDGQQVGYEGAGIIKVAGKYVLYAAEWNGDIRIDGTYDMMYSTSDSLYGPYSPRQLLIPHGGHGCLFYDFDGRLRFTMFGNDRTAPFSRSAAIGYVGIRWENDQLILYPQDNT